MGALWLGLDGDSRRQTEGPPTDYPGPGAMPPVSEHPLLGHPVSIWRPHLLPGLGLGTEVALNTPAASWGGHCVPLLCVAEMFHKDMAPHKESCAQRDLGFMVAMSFPSTLGLAVWLHWPVRHEGLRCHRMWVCS